MDFLSSVRMFKTIESSSSSSSSANSSTDSTSTEEEYVVEKILDSRTSAHGTKQYLLKWVGYDHSENTWESADDLKCHGLIAAYEAERARTSASKQKNEEKFEHTLKPEKILGATVRSGQLTFLMKWQGCDEVDWVTARQANVLYPQVVISFYEERIRWINVSDDRNDAA